MCVYVCVCVGMCVCVCGRVVFVCMVICVLGESYFSELFLEPSLTRVKYFTQVSYCLSLFWTKQDHLTPFSLQHSEL